MKRYLSDSNRVYRLIAIGALAVLAVAIIPLMVIGKYAVPCADDYTYGYYTHAFWTTTHSLRQTLHWALYQVKASYDTWQGTFSSAFIMSLSPAVWGDQYYIFTPVLMIFMIVVPQFYLLYVLLVKLLQTSKSIWCIVSSIVSFCMIEMMPSPVNAYYWFNGAVHYIFMYGCMILLFAIAIQMGNTDNRKKNMGYYLGACVLAVACGGGNYSTALLGMLGLVFVVALKWVLGYKKVWNVIPVAVYAFALFKNVTAYGNNIRQSNFEQPTALEAVLDSFKYICVHISNWLTLPLVLFVLLLVPFLWEAVRTERFDFRWPVAVTALSFGSVACTITPSLYAMNSTGPDRLINVSMMWFILMLVCNLAYWIGYVRKAVKGKGIHLLAQTGLAGLGIFMAVILAALFIQFTNSGNGKLLNYSSYAAYVSLATGEARAFYDEYLARLEVLNNDEPVVTLEPYKVKPWLLFFDDITTDPYDWRNQSVAAWFYKERVYLGQ